MRQATNKARTTKKTKHTEVGEAVGLSSLHKDEMDVSQIPERRDKMRQKHPHRVAEFLDRVRGTDRDGRQRDARISGRVGVAHDVLEHADEIVCATRGLWVKHKDVAEERIAFVALLLRDRNDRELERLELALGVGAFRWGIQGKKNVKKEPKASIWLSVSTVR